MIYSILKHDGMLAVRLLWLWSTLIIDSDSELLVCVSSKDLKSKGVCYFLVGRDARAAVDGRRPPRTDATTQDEERETLCFRVRAVHR
jgi:hypothetical protein